MKIEGKPLNWLAFAGFVASLCLWPRHVLTEIPLYAFLPHGLFACWLIWRGIGYRALGWPLAAWLFGMQWLDWPLATVLAASLLTMVPGARRLRRKVAMPSNTTAVAPLMWQLLEMAFYLALPPVLALAAYASWFGRWPAVLQWGGLLWCCATLAMSCWLPLLRPASWPERRRLMELLLIMLVMLVEWCSMVSNAQSLPFPRPVLFFPLLVWAAFRGRLLGACLAASLLCLLLSLPSFMPGLYLHGGVAELTTDAVLCLAFNMAALLVATLSDVHKRKEDELIEFRSRIEALVNNSPNMMSLKGLDGRFLLANRAYARMLGVSDHAMVGSGVQDYFSIEDAERIRQQDELVLSCLEPRQFEESISLHGEVLTMLVNKFPLFDSVGRPAGVGSVDTDITRNRQQQKARKEAEEKYWALVEQTLVGIYIMQDDRLVYVNPKLASIVGYSVEQMQNMPLEQLLLESEAGRIRRQVRQRLRENITVMHYTTRAITSTGQLVDLEVHSRLVEYDGKPALIGVVVDISERIAADANLKLAAKVFENSAEGILILDAAAHIIAVNHAFTRITGYKDSEALGKLSRIFDNSDPQSCQMQQALALHDQWQGEMLDRRKNGDWYPAELSISLVRDDAGLHSNYVAVFSDITLRKQAEERLQFLANHDPLTSLPNRSSMIASLERAILEQAGQTGQLAVMFIDLDRFKLINDSFGHQSGDDLLREIAIRLVHAVGERGLLARLGGDEFTLLLTEFADQAELSVLAEDILSVLGRGLRLEEHEVFISGSIGISVFPNDGTDARSLLKNADVAMYRAKDAGKNTYQFFDAEMNTQTFERLLLENGMRLALERGEFELHYQPQLNASSRELAGVEALIRWRHPQLGLVPPLRFIPLAEETGLIKPIGDWVLQEACRQLARWDAAGLHVPRVAVNLSARQFEQSALVQNVAQALLAAGLEASRLELEITESMIMQNPVETVQQLGELKSLGVWLSIDDFGTGYSSLSHLKRFPLDTLKIDRSFVDGLPADEDSAAIAEAILAMAKKLKFTVVAEGVENAAQADFLQLKGCTLLQGYHFGKPVPAGEFPALLQGLEAARSQQALSADWQGGL